jgi:hypothetical protein
MPLLQIILGGAIGIGVAYLALAALDLNYSDFMGDGGYPRGDRNDQHKKKLD